MSFSRLFGHAAFGAERDVLNEISDDDINLAVCSSVLSEQSEAFIDSLPLDRIADADADADADSYYTVLAGLNFSCNQYYNGLSNLFSCLSAYGDTADLIKDIDPLTGIFADITRQEGLAYIYGQLIVFRPRTRSAGEGLGNAGFWHEDGGHNIGICTLKGDCGTLWKPNHIALRNRDVNSLDQDFIQQTNIGDFSIFNGIEKANPLTHATPVAPFTKENRLVLLLGNVQPFNPPSS